MHSYKTKANNHFSVFHENNANLKEIAKSHICAQPKLVFSTLTKI